MCLHFRFVDHKFFCLPYPLNIHCCLVYVSRIPISMANPFNVTADLRTIFQPEYINVNSIWSCCVQKVKFSLSKPRRHIGGVEV